MLLTLLDNILPGTRSLRPPIISGILWAIFLWVILSDLIPLPHEAEGGLAAQAYSLASAAGPIFTVFVASVFIFAVGALMSATTESLANIVGDTVRAMQRRWRWQRQAQRTRRQLRATISKKAEELAEANKELENAPTDEDSKVRQQCQQKVDVRKQEVDWRTDHLSLLNRPRFRYSPFTWWLLRRISFKPIHENPKTRDIVRDPAQESRLGLELSVITAYREQAVNAAIQRSEIAEPPTMNDVIGKGSETRSRVNSNQAFAAQLAEELRADPLDVLRALNEKHFLSLDQKRAERELRLALSSPTIALGLLAWTITYNNWGLVVVAIGVVVFFRYSLQGSDEAARVLHLISTANLETAAIRRASIAGLDDWRVYMADRAKNERRRAREQRTLDQAQQNQGADPPASVPENNAITPPAPA